MVTTSNGQSRELPRLAPAIAAALLALAVGLLLFLSTGHDDAYITFWSAHALLELGEIVNYSGERVEQSSSLLHTLWLAAAAALSGQPLPAIGYWTGIVFGVLAVLRSLTLSLRLGWGAPAWLAFLVATLPISLYWWFGGLETTLMAWLTIEVAIAACDLLAGRRSVASPAVLAATAGYLMVRPETFAVLFSALGSWLVLERLGSRARGAAPEPGSRALQRWALAAAALFALLLLFRLTYFGQLLPQPVYAKIGGSGAGTLAAGLVYYLKAAVLRPYALTFSASLAAAAALGFRALHRRLPADARLFALLLLGANAGFVLFAGGDWMRGGRFFAHFAPLALVAGAGALRELGPGPRLRLAVLTLAFVANGAGVLALGLGESSGRPLWRFLERDTALRAHAGETFHWSERANRVRTRDLLFVGAMNRTLEAVLAQSEPVTILSRQAGMVMFYVATEHFGRIRFIDAYGLTSPEANEIAASLGLERGSTGTQITPPQLIEALERERGPASRPDIVFDIYPTAPELAKLGYRIVYEQAGSAPGVALKIGAMGPYEVAYSVYEFVAVDARWARLFPPHPEALLWNGTPGERP